VATTDAQGQLIRGADETPVPVGVLIAAFAAGAVAQGGYYPAGRALVTALVAVALFAALWVRRWSRADLGPIVLACLALGLWVLVRGWTAAADATTIAALATLGCLAAAVLVLRRTSPAARQRCAGALVSVGALVAATAWVGVAWRVPRFAVLVEHRLWRGASTLTYPNAAAALVVPLALLAIAMLVARPRSLVRAGAAYLLLVGAGAALSRAGIIALLAGLAVLALLAGARATLRSVAPLLLGAALAVAALAPSFPATARPHPLLALAGLLAGGAVAIGLARLPRRARAVALTAAAALAAAAAALTVRSGGAYLQPILASRANLDSSGRSLAARSALAQIAEHPWSGTGIGLARFVWTRPDGNASIARYAHNEYLQTLVDLGVIGGILLLALLASIVVTVARGRRHPHPPGIWAGAAAALAALAVHSGFDFLWHIAVLPLAAGLLIGLAAPATSEEPNDSGLGGPHEAKEH
jgi:O-Antigen ligase